MTLVNCYLIQTEQAITFISKSPSILYSSKLLNFLFLHLFSFFLLCISKYSQIFYFLQNIHHMFQDLTSLVVDMGLSTTKIGYGGDEAPKIFTSSYVGLPTSMDGQRQFLAGNNSLHINKTDLEIESIYQHSEETNYPLVREEHFEKFLDSLICKELKTNIKDYSVLFNEDINLKPSDAIKQRTLIAEIMFHKFDIPNIFFLKTPVLGCFATGRSTALVIDSGEFSTRVVGVHDGFTLNKTAKIIPYGGRTINEQIEKYFRLNNVDLESKYSLNGSIYTNSFLDFHKNQLIRDIKEHFPMKNPEDMAEDGTKVIYELPDKKTITIEKAQISNPLTNINADWNRQFGQYQYKGLAEAVVDNINSNDIEIRKELYSNILMTGGNILFSDTSDAVFSKISALAPPNAKVRAVSIFNITEKKYLSWIGGSIVTSLSAFQGYWIGKKEYEEQGDLALERKCI